MDHSEVCRAWRTCNRAGRDEAGGCKAGREESAEKVNRWNAIAESAAKQSGRGIVPEVLPVMKWKEALEYARQLDVKMIPYEKAAGINATKQLIGSVSFGQSVGIFIGPEGGFEEAEVEAAKAMGAVPVTLGKGSYEQRRPE